MFLEKINGNLFIGRRNNRVSKKKMDKQFLANWSPDMSCENEIFLDWKVQKRIETHMNNLAYYKGGISNQC